MSEEEKNDNIGEENIFECPHCKEYIIIEKINCGIFRHGVLKSGKQIEPHSPKYLCDYYINSDMIYGCGKPFKILLKDNKYKIEICDYI
jgi:hypothetical protein